jgi:hypothetical protein
MGLRGVNVEKFGSHVEITGRTDDGRSWLLHTGDMPGGIELEVVYDPDPDADDNDADAPECLVLHAVDLPPEAWVALVNIALSSRLTSR